MYGLGSPPYHSKHERHNRFIVFIPSNPSFISLPRSKMHFKIPSMGHFDVLDMLLYKEIMDIIAQAFVHEVLDSNT